MREEDYESHNLSYSLRCPYCKSPRIGINRDGLAVCMDCGATFQTFDYSPTGAQHSSTNVHVPTYSSSPHVEREFFDSRPLIRNLANEMFNYCITYDGKRTGNRRTIEYCLLATKAVIDIIVRNKDPWPWLEREMKEYDMQERALRRKMEKILRHYCVVIRPRTAGPR